jgi:hypothetical protein
MYASREYPPSNSSLFDAGIVHVACVTLYQVSMYPECASGEKLPN